MDVSPPQTHRDDQLADPRIAGFIHSPNTILTADECNEVLVALDRSIAHMEAQSAGYQSGDLNREASWFRRLSYALSMRRSEKRRVERRSRELRGIDTLRAQLAEGRGTPAEAKLAKEQRLLADAETRKAQKMSAAAGRQIAAMEASYKNRMARRFMAAARETLPEDVFLAIEAKAQNPAHSSEEMAA